MAKGSMKANLSMKGGKGPTIKGPKPGSKSAFMGKAPKKLDPRMSMAKGKGC